MNKNNSIDSFFQEKLNNLEVAPPQMAWNNIERELKKKNNRKVIPLWWKFSGVAAILAIGFFIGTQFNENFKSQKTESKEQMSKDKIVNTNNQNSTNGNSNSKNDNNVAISSQKKLNSSKKEDLIQNAVSIIQIKQNQGVVKQVTQKSNISNPNDIALNKLKSNKKALQKRSETEEYQVTENVPFSENQKVVQTSILPDKPKLDNQIDSENKSTENEIASPEVSGLAMTDKKPSLIVADQEKQNLIEEKTDKKP
jgi:hypothetical protein